MKSIFNWSGGKDSALALYHTLKEKKYNVTTLLTTVNEEYDRVSMHGVRKQLLYKQAEAIGIPVKAICLPESPSMLVYETIMKKELLKLQKTGITHSLFGDIFLEDLKHYRENKLQEIGLSAHFPLWKRNTPELIREFIDLGFRTIIVCVKADVLGQEFAGRIIDKDFLTDLPKNIDPCGENGEFHTFVFDGPIFKNPIPIEVGKTIYREYINSCASNTTNCSSKANICPSSNSTSKNNMGFYFCDLLEKQNPI